MMKPRDRLVLGALAGMAATLPMTMAMRRLHARLPAAQRYPLPPREITAKLPLLGLTPPTATLVHHFAYGSAAGAIFGLLPPRHARLAGPFFGVGVWVASYLGWLPLMGVLRPATVHPAPRNTLMLAVHLVWGAGLAAGLRELELARRFSFTRATSPAPVLQDRPDEVV
ncbi:hypothetical protein [Ancylobacter polymorphus]|uniref:DUF1440 domain-containing protein n=1 Tax=Ancylobacter polymorphus TaxID=223390 RepID=A0ABU0BDD1_9HYPH|nr:hypothetical protein [Ancylobacter polymorphus]MDQ0303619.1 hypothetical protein [Ancylobacter polymorphus]